MKRQFLINPILILSLLIASAAVFLSPMTAKAETATHGDLFVLGTDSDYSDPILFRMDANGNVLWNIALPFQHFLNMDVSADRNQAEDAFYMIADSYFRSNQIDGKNRVLKYNAQGVNEWDVPLSPNAVVLSANPVYGGIYVSDANLGIYRVDSQGNIVWGPKNFGLVSVNHWAVSTDLTDGGAFVSEHNNGQVLKIDANGNVIWSRAVPLPERINACPIDGGVYVGSDSYSRDTYKLGPDGTVEWVKTYFPSLQNPPRNVNPFDGSLYALGAWPSKFARVTFSGNVLWNIDTDLIGGLPIAVDLQEGGGYAYTTEMWSHLGITKIDAANGSVVWRKDPGFYTYPGGDPSPSYLVYSGLPANLSSATLTATTTSSDIYPGDSVSVSLDIQNADNLYAMQTACAADPAVLAVQNGEFGDFFDPASRFIAENAVAAGVWNGAVSLLNPALPLTGNGNYATLTYEGVSPGTATISCDGIMSDQDGNELDDTYVGASITVLPFATIDGIATYQGRAAHSGIDVTATGVVTRSDITDAIGAFLLDALKAGTYDIQADAPLYLPNCTSEAVTPGQVLTLANTQLRGGDTNDDDDINIGDATLVAANFRQAVPPADARADINGDGVVNIKDLALLGSNYGRSGCQAW